MHYLYLMKKLLLISALCILPTSTHTADRVIDMRPVRAGAGIVLGSVLLGTFFKSGYAQIINPLVTLDAVVGASAAFLYAGAQLLLPADSVQIDSNAHEHNKDLQWRYSPERAAKIMLLSANAALGYHNSVPSVLPRVALMLCGAHMMTQPDQKGNLKKFNATRIAKIIGGGALFGFKHVLAAPIAHGLGITPEWTAGMLETAGTCLLADGIFSPVS